MTAKPYESIKIHSDDYGRVEEIRANRGLPLIESIGCAVEGWSYIPRKVQDRIIRDRAQRKHAETVPS